MSIYGRAISKLQAGSGRFITGLDRADEALELYSEPGFEVHPEPVLTNELAGECDECALIATGEFKTICT